MEDREACEEMLRIILEQPDLIVVDNQPQRNLRNVGTRSVILDVLCRLGNGRLVCVEMQQADNDDHIRRARYLISCTDVASMDKGAEFKEIPDVCIIYITTFDFFKAGKTVYHVRRVVEETGLAVDDGTMEIFVNTAVHDGSRIAELMEYFTNSKPGGSFTALGKRVAFFKETQQGERVMCELLEKLVRESRAEGKKEGKDEGWEEGLLFAIRTLMPAMNLTFDQAMDMVRRNAGKRADSNTLQPAEK